MSNCLITKLNTTVSENLDKFGTIVISATKNGTVNKIDASKISLKGSIGTKISVDGEGYFSDNFDDMVNRNNCKVEYTLDAVKTFNFYFTAGICAIFDCVSTTSTT